MTDLEEEITDRYAGSLNYLMERTAFEIDSDLERGEPRAAAARASARALRRPSG